MPLDGGFLSAFRLFGIAVHLHRLTDLALIDRLGLEREHRGVSYEDLHLSGTALRSVRIVRRARVLALMVVIDFGEEQRAVVHNNNILCLIRFQQPFVLRPSHVLQRRIRFNVTLYNAGQSKCQVLKGRRERDLRWICKN